MASRTDKRAYWNYGAADLCRRLNLEHAVAVNHQVYPWLISLVCLLLLCPLLGSAADDLIIMERASLNEPRQSLALPDRPTTAPSGSEFFKQIASMDFAHREAAIAQQICLGNVPDFLRHLAPVTLTNVTQGETNILTFFVTSDYLGIGTDQDWVLTPMSPITAQIIANATDASLPTRKMVDLIQSAAPVKLSPSPIPPSSAMTSVAVFAEHDREAKKQRNRLLKQHPLGTLVAGHKKDLVLTPRLAQAPGKEALYGWHHPDGTVIQPLYLGHTVKWVDYSHGIRLVQQRVLLNGQPHRLEKLLNAPKDAVLLSDEGPISHPRYPTNFSSPALSRPLSATNPAKAFEFRWQSGPATNEQSASLELERGVRIYFNAPTQTVLESRNVLLVLYALPNGNTIEQTLGRAPKATNEWRFDIQHIAAQTRFVRERLTNQAVVVVCLQNNLLSWPAWRKQHGDLGVRSLVEGLKASFTNRPLELVLNGHSGGGSFTFGYLNTVDRIPDDIVRIAFLDSNYAYDPALKHDQKIVEWLKRSPDHYLCVLAYDDASARLNGKPFVSATGGTWGRSHAMVNDLSGPLNLHSQTNGLMEQYTALAGRVQFLLRQNPDQKIYHTVLVEKNGFLHSLFIGTPLEQRDYEYLGARAYSRWVE